MVLFLEWTQKERQVLVCSYRKWDNSALFLPERNKVLSFGIRGMTNPTNEERIEKLNISIHEMSKIIHKLCVTTKFQLPIWLRRRGCTRVDDNLHQLTSVAQPPRHLKRTKYIRQPRGSFEWYWKFYYYVHFAVSAPLYRSGLSTSFRHQSAKMA